MNRIKAFVTRIEKEQNLHIIHFEAEHCALKMMGLELPKGLHENSYVTLGVKPSSVALGKNLGGILSYSNQMQCTIDAVEKGKLLCSVYASVGSITMQSIITRGSFDRMDLHVNDSVTLLIKASELFIVEVLDA
ncbi:TOBE domain-containing protein [Sulfurospirillum deleyianum]|uniref:TOBE domain protein n=1 Tax=Sulfurospirillum deleyianum (strain ATCC 51133 / DSM 6946 / 5175) TaxID=525898 RepID=D1B3R3_SULD5|nr:TOBE domain-containing protein [Sulfurospirillum deleyianum]ACZ12733.1 TOBE domain protein [Sulfurospirillum deleyianum DSM 6946]